MQYWIVPGLKFRETRKLTSDSIVDITCDHLGVPRALLQRKGRQRRLVEARQICFYFIRKYTDLSLLEAGIIFRQDHTTAIHGIQKVEGFLHIKDKKMLRTVFELEELFIKSIKPL